METPPMPWGNAFAVSRNLNPKSCPLMTLQEASVEEDRWSPIEVLIWIATRSRRFMDALRGLPLSCVEDRLWHLQSENHSPYPLTLSTALLAFHEEVQRGSIRGLEWEFPRAKDGTIRMFNMHEFALIDISFRAADVLRTWPDWPLTLAWNAAKTRPWQAPSGISKAWIRSLPAGDYLPFADVVDLVAFGPAKVAIGLSDIDEHAAQLRAGIAIVNAAIEGKGGARRDTLRAIADAAASLAQNRPSHRDRSRNVA